MPFIFFLFRCVYYYLLFSFSFILFFLILSFFLSFMYYVNVCAFFLYTHIRNLTSQFVLQLLRMNQIYTVQLACATYIHTIHMAIYIQYVYNITAYMCTYFVLHSRALLSIDMCIVLFCRI